MICDRRQLLRDLLATPDEVVASQLEAVRRLGWYRGLEPSEVLAHTNEHFYLGVVWSETDRVDMWMAHVERTLNGAASVREPWS